ncbi:armadillo-type protein [Mycena rebaudengoi]|nr:armadillo-type protein [Mycena rebaudengoi]
MPPFTRQKTLESLASWWSDSNPPGATLNLHAATKPLMRLLYERQALDFLRKNNAIPLSSQTVPIYLSYLSWPYVSSSTKITILRHLATRVKSEREALVLKDSNMSHILLELVQTENWRVLGSTAVDVLSNLALHRSIAASICGPLVILLRDHEEHTEVLQRLLWTLCSIVARPVAAEAAVEANLLHHAEALLTSPNTEVCSLGCLILRNMASESITRALLEMGICELLVALLRDNIEDERSCIAGAAFDTLSPMASDPAVAEALVATEVLNHVATGLVSPRPRIRLSACSFLRQIGRHRFTVLAIVGAVPYDWLAGLLSDENDNVRGCAADTCRLIAFALTKIDEASTLDMRHAHKYWANRTFPTDKTPRLQWKGVIQIARS